MKLQPKNWLLQTKTSISNFILQGAIICLLFLFVPAKAQVANYVNNGGFEKASINNPQLPAYWNAIDSSKFMGILLSYSISPYLVPLSSYTYQWPRSGNNFLIGTEYFATCTNQSCVGYPRNRLKQTLQASKTYCFKMYVNLSNQSSYAIDALGVYFADSSTDTITKCTLPITYLSPQIKNISGNILSDTLGWTLITGTYTAIGTEQYIIVGNFNTNANTNKTLVNPTNLPAIFSANCYDDISLIEIDLPAYAGFDAYALPGNTVYIGRPQDVGIDEACIWYKLPNTTTAIDTAAGLTVTVAATSQTYMVKQDICGIIKYDTVVVYAGSVGLNELKIKDYGLKIYPNPVTEILNIELNPSASQMVPDYKLEIVNALGQIIREEEIIFKNNIAVIDIKELANGVYEMTLVDYAHSERIQTVSKRFVIAR